MDKPAETQYPVHDLIRRRWSPRAFSEQALAPEAVHSLLEAARWAASANNSQPWHYLVFRREEGPAFERMVACLSASNQTWAPAAPLLLVSVVDTVNRTSGKPLLTAWHDAGMANAQLFLQATAMGLSMHMMGGIDRERIRSEFGLPEQCHPICAIAVGHPGDPAALSPENQEKERAGRVRRPQAEFAFKGGWTQPAFDAD